MYRNPGASGPPLRDFNSIIQTCSGNIQRISQASEPGYRAGGRGPSRGQARVRLPGRGARPGLRPGPHLRPSWVLCSGYGGLLSPSLPGPGTPRVRSPSCSSSFFSGVLLLRCWGQDSSPDSRRVGGCVCVPSRAVNESTGCSGQPSFSCHLPPSTHLSFLFGQLGSGVVSWFRLYILLSFWLLGSQKLSVKGSGECMCFGDFNTVLPVRNLEIRYNDLYSRDEMTSTLIKRIHQKHFSLHSFVFCNKRFAYIFGFQADEAFVFLPHLATLLNKHDTQRSSGTWP